MVAALARETGARGLAATLTRQLEDVAFSAFGEDSAGAVRVSLQGDRVVAMKQ